MTETLESYWKKMCKILILLFTFCLFAPFCATAADDDDDYALQYTTPDKFLEIWSDHRIDSDRCNKIADRVLKAYAFVAQQEAWQDQKLLWSTPLRFRVVDSNKTKILGVAIGANLFVIKDSYLDDELSDGTMAHELTHIQDKRQAKKGIIPSFLLEGRALTNGHSYRISLGQADNKYDCSMAKSATTFTSADAEELLDDTEGVGWNNQAMGTFLVEYMRTKWNGNGVRNVHPRLSKMIERIGTGVNCEAAFEQEFGSPYSALLKSFMKYLDDTQHNPMTRLQGTMWESVATTLQPKETVDEDADEE
jgi:hypothetical protein